MKPQLPYIGRAASIIMLVFAITPAFTQSPAPDTIVTPAKNIYKNYMAAVGGAANLYNGTEYTASYPLTTGTPFWNNAEFQKGTISYEGVVYHDIPIAYELVTNEVLIKGFQQLIIKLDASKVDFFEISGHRFVRLGPDENSTNQLPEDIYDLVLDGKIKVYIRRRKQVERSFNTEDPNRFASYNAYFVHKDNAYHQVSSRNALLSLFRDKDNEIKKMWDERKLNFKTDAEKTIIETVTFYTRLKG